MFQSYQISTRGPLEEYILPGRSASINMHIKPPPVSIQHSDKLKRPN